MELILKEEYKSRIGWRHSTWRAAAELEEAAKVDKLCLYFFNPDPDDEKIEEFLGSAKEILPKTSAGVEKSIEEDAVANN